MLTQLHHFESIVKRLIIDAPALNLVIGGACALKLHGLILAKEPVDMDLVIYQPTPVQKQFLHTLKAFSAPNTTAASVRNSHKFTVQPNPQSSYTSTLDILIEDEPLPMNLLKAHSTALGMDIYVQSIENVMQARNRYVFKGSDLKHYVRRKDVIDCIQLKNLNFNLTEDENK